MNSSLQIVSFSVALTGVSVNKAKIVAHNGVVFGCPKCDFIFSYDYSTAPTEVSTYEICEQCNEALLVKPVTISVKFKKCTLDKKPKKKNKEINRKKYEVMNKAIDEARAVVKSYGFTVKQFDNALNTIDSLYKPGWKPLPTEDLVKQILSRIDNKYEQATTD